MAALSKRFNVYSLTNSLNHRSDVLADNHFNSFYSNLIHLNPANYIRVQHRITYGC